MSVVNCKSSGDAAESTKECQHITVEMKVVGTLKLVFRRLCRSYEQRCGTNLVCNSWRICNAIMLMLVTSWLNGHTEDEN